MATTYPNGPVAPDSGDWIPEDGVKHMQTLAATTDAALAERATTEYVDDGLENVEAFAEQKYEDATSYTEAVDSASIARDDALAAQIEGMEGMTYVGEWSEGTEYRVNDVVVYDGESWARLTDGSEGVPGAAPEDWGLVARRGEGGGFGDLKETDVTGLYDTVETQITPESIGAAPAEHTHPTSDVIGLDERLEVLEQDTGWRDVTAGITPAPAQGVLALRRIGNTVWADFRGLTGVPPSSAWYSFSGALPAGFRSPRNFQYMALPSSLPSVTTGPLRIATNGSIVIYNAKNSSGTALSVEALVSWVTDDAFPEPVPGTQILEPRRNEDVDPDFVAPPN